MQEIVKQCKLALYALVGHGSEVCSQFEADAGKTYFCKKCRYSQYIHLCKQIVDTASSE